MEEVITIDGRQFKLTTNRQLTLSEKEQTITDIRNGKLENIGKVNTLQNSVCVTLNASSGTAGPSISIQDITIGTVDCGTGPTCPGDYTCMNPDCSDSVTVIVTFANSGDTDGSATPTLSINGTDSGTTPSEGAQITIPAGGSATATFVGITLSSGPNTVCASWT